MVNDARALAEALGELQKGRQVDSGRVQLLVSDLSSKARELKAMQARLSGLEEQVRRLQDRLPPPDQIKEALLRDELGSQRADALDKAYRQYRIGYNLLEKYNRAADSIEYFDAAIAIKPFPAFYRAKGFAFYLTGQPVEAASAWQDGLKLSIEKGLKDEEAALLNDLAAVDFLLGDVDQARRNAEQGLQISQRLLDLSDRCAAVRANNVAQLLLAAGDLDAAGKYMDEAIVFAQRAAKNALPNVADSCFSVDQVVITTPKGSESRALPVPPIRVSPADTSDPAYDPLLITLQSNKAMILLRSGDPAGAFALATTALEQAKKVYQRSNMTFASIQVNLAQILEVDSNVNGALTCLRAALETYKRRQSSDRGREPDWRVSVLQEEIGRLEQAATATRNANQRKADPCK
jgi:tetratricopeptide (TPR) repeat protein